MTDGFWAVVKANVAAGADPQREQALNEWWSEEHVPEYVALDGFRHGWRLGAVDAEGGIGTSIHRYYAVYEVDQVADFNAALEMGSRSHPGRPWGPWQEFVDDYLIDWERTYYRVLHREDPEDSAGRYWAIVRADVDFEGPEHEGEFESWYTHKHMPEICSYPGIHRAWRVRVEPDDNDLGPRRQRLWGVYQIDRPEDFAAARDDRTSRGIQPWDGVWLPHLSNFEITFHELIYETSK